MATLRRLRTGERYRSAKTSSFAVLMLELTDHAPNAGNRDIINEILTATAATDDTDGIEGAQFARYSVHPDAPGSQLILYDYEVVERVHITQSKIALFYRVNNSGWGAAPGVIRVGSRWSAQTQIVGVRLFYKQPAIALVNQHPKWREQVLDRTRAVGYFGEHLTLELTSQQASELADEVFSQMGRLYHIGGVASSGVYMLTGAELVPSGNGEYQISYHYATEQTWPALWSSNDPNIPGGVTPTLGDDFVSVPAVPSFSRLEIGHTTFNDAQLGTVYIQPFYRVIPNLPLMGIGATLTASAMVPAS